MYNKFLSYHTLYNMSTLKPVLVAGAIVALDKYALNQTNLNN